MWSPSKVFCLIRLVRFGQRRLVVQLAIVISHFQKTENRKKSYKNGLVQNGPHHHKTFKLSFVYTQ